MKLPKQLETLRERKIWLCYPMIWNESKHNGVGGYDKPPVNPYTLYNGSSDNPESLATYDEAVAQIGKTAHVNVKGYEGLLNCEIVGVGIAFSGSGIAGIDLDNVVDRERSELTPEAAEIIELMNTYTEVSPSGTGLHILFFGTLPEKIKKIAKPKKDIFGTDKAEYQLFDSGYMTISGLSLKPRREIAERTDQVAELCKKHFQQDIVAPILRPSTEKPRVSPSVVSSSGYTYERWLDDVRRLSDAEILENIFKSGETGRRVEALYRGDTSEYGNDHSRADQALCTFLYGFTDDRVTTERLFRTSGLYRASGKSRNYLDRTLNKAEIDRVRLIGHITFTAEEKRAYAKRKEKEERAAGKSFGSFLRDRARKRGN